ncbi:excinuclease ABC subunit B, partial [candidate division KSB1 bacterium]
VGINLLREGLDLPEVSLVAILDADKMGFLRSERSLMQTAGRAARNVDGTVIFYADKMTDAICKVRDETNRRRMIQKKYNEKHNITPKTIYKSVDEIMSATAVADVGTDNISAYDSKSVLNLAPAEIEEVLDMLERDMMKAAENLDFEKAAKYRDMMAEIKSHKKINTGRYG